MARRDGGGAVSPTLILPELEGTQLEEFVALVAHEVRTPLAIARSAAETVLELDEAGALNADQRRDLLEMVERNLDLAALLLDRMSLARSLEADTLDLATEVVDFGGLVSQSVDDLRHAVLGDHPTEVTCAEGLLVDVDQTAAREIVFNLLSNAAKYSTVGAPIDVTVVEHEGSVRMVVRNHGSGVTPGDTERIFEKFFQGVESTSGVGLGLFISRGLARAHGGDLTIRPAADAGSEFVLDLPRHG